MGKRGQTSIFIIVGIIIAVLLILLFSYTNINFGEFSLISFDKQTEIIDNGIRNCFEDLYKEATNEVGFQGGYYYEPLGEYLKSDLNSIPFYYFGELEYIPDRELIGEQIALNIDSKKERCFNLFESSSLSYEYYYNLAKISIKEKSIEFNNNLDLTLTKGESTSTTNFGNSIKGIKSNLFAMNNLASYIAFSYNANEENICLSCFQEIAINEELIVEFDDSLENILIVNIIERKENSFPRFYKFALSATKDLEEDRKLPPNYDESPNFNPSDPELNFNTANFEDE
jgi:hypothetical protein